jgi:hypothetical protein
MQTMLLHNIIAFYGANAGTAGGNAITWNTVGFAQDEDGNVGIGTTAPATKLEVLQTASGTPLSLRSQAGNSGNVGLRFSIADNSVTTDAYNKAAIYLAGAGTTNALGDMVFAVNNTASSANVSLADERLRITATGNVLIGTATDSGFKLRVNGEILADDDIRIFNTFALVLNGTDNNWRIGRNTITDSGWLTGNTMQMVVFGWKHWSRIPSS